MTLSVAVLALAGAGAAAADSTPVGPLPKPAVTTVTTAKGSLVAVALPRQAPRTGLVWRVARPLDTRVVIDMVSPEMQRVTMYTDAGLLSEERRHMEIVYRRAGQGAFASPDRQSDRPIDRQNQPQRRTP